MIQIPPPPFKTNVTDHSGQMTQTWQRHVLATQQTITTDAAPADARYVVATANPSLTAEVNLGALSAGYLKQAVAAGVASPSTTATIPATDLSGTIPDARFPATLPAVSGVNLTNLNATNLGSGTVPDARFPATLPALNGSALTALNASQLTSGTLPDARLGSPLPALSGVNLTGLKGINVTHQVVTKVFADSPYTVLSTDETVLVDATGGAVSITLPTPTSGRVLCVKKIDASANAVTLTGTVDGVVNPTLPTQYNSRMIQGDGSTWNLIATV